MRQRGLELIAAFGLLTRLPVWRLTSDTPANFAGAVWAYPLVGAVVGTLGGLVYWLAIKLGLSASLGAIWTLAALLLITGGLHEDGLADTADGFGGGRTRERKLEIMRDSRIGSYGALALMAAMGIRAVALSTIATPAAVTASLIIAGTLSRAAIIVVLSTTGPARTDGMAAGLGASPWIAVTAGLVIALSITALLTPLWHMLPAIAVAFAMRHIALRQIGGHTGDVLGATALITECAVLSLMTL